MMRQRALQILLALFGLACLAGLYPLTGALRDGVASSINRQDQMILGIYIVLGVFLLSAARSPRDHRSFILFAGWSTVAHDSVMVVQGFNIAICLLISSVSPSSPSSVLLSSLWPPQRRRRRRLIWPSPGRHRDPPANDRCT